MCYTTPGVQLETNEQSLLTNLLSFSLSNQGSWSDWKRDDQVIYCWKKDNADSEDEGSLWESNLSENCEGIEYVGLGRERNGAFVTKLSDSNQFKLCEKDCWTEDSDYQGLKLSQWAKEKSDNWKNISFFDTQKSNLLSS